MCMSDLMITKEISLNSTWYSDFRPRLELRTENRQKHMAANDTNGLLSLERSISNHFSAPEQDVIRGSLLGYYTPSHPFVLGFAVPEPYNSANTGRLSSYSMWGSNPRDM